jgi:hypothetical protein
MTDCHLDIVVVVKFKPLLHIIYISVLGKHYFFIFLGNLSHSLLDIRINPQNSTLFDFQYPFAGL